MIHLVAAKASFFVLNLYHRQHFWAFSKAFYADFPALNDSPCLFSKKKTLFNNLKKVQLNRLRNQHFRIERLDSSINQLASVHFLNCCFKGRSELELFCHVYVLSDDGLFDEAIEIDRNRSSFLYICDAINAGQGSVMLLFCIKMHQTSSEVVLLRVDASIFKPWFLH